MERTVKLHLNPAITVPTVIGSEKPMMSKGVEYQYMNVSKPQIRWNSIMAQAVIAERRLAVYKKRALSDLVTVIFPSSGLTSTTSVFIENISYMTFS